MKKVLLPVLLTFATLILTGCEKEQTASSLDRTVWKLTNRDISATLIFYGESKGILATYEEGNLRAAAPFKYILDYPEMTIVIEYDDAARVEFTFTDSKTLKPKLSPEEEEEMNSSGYDITFHKQKDLYNIPDAASIVGSKWKVVGGETVFFQTNATGQLEMEGNTYPFSYTFDGIAGTITQDGKNHPFCFIDNKIATAGAVLYRIN